MSPFTKADPITWAKDKGSTLFSWKIDSSLYQTVTTYQESLGITRVFQYIFPHEYGDGTLQRFVLDMSQKNISTFALDGGSNWATSAEGFLELKAFINQVVSYNAGQPESARLQGIVLDVEPAQEASWKHNETATMKTFVNTMKTAYQYASGKGLYVVICIPFWYDEHHLSQLSQLIQHGCDEVAVMNYSRGNELSTIQTEVVLSRLYTKPILSIFEFEAPNNTSVFEQNTYFAQGPEVAMQKFYELDAHFS